MIALLTLTLKKTISSQVLAANKVLGDKVFAANKFDDMVGGDRLSDRSKRMETKIGRSESQKSAKFQKSSKSKGKKSKKQSKSENSLIFDALEAGPSFLTSGARTAFNRL